MIDPSMTNIHPYPPTMQELELRVIELNTEINRLTSEVEALQSDRDYWRGQSNNRQAQIDALEMYVKENFDYIDEDVSQNLVEIFSLEITKDYDVTVTVTFSGTVSVPLNYDIDNLENDLSANLDSHYYSADVEADFSEDRMEIDWSES
jgi:hypothetical protein